MKDDAIIPLQAVPLGGRSRWPRSSASSSASRCSARCSPSRCTCRSSPGLTPTESGFATLPMVARPDDRLDRLRPDRVPHRPYRIFPVTGTAFTALGFLVLTFMTIDKPLWFLMIGMFLIGLGLGQLMQTLTLASQNSVAAAGHGRGDQSSSTFFRQIGGTLGTAILLSVLFSVMPGNILHRDGGQGEPDLRARRRARPRPSPARRRTRASWTSSGTRSSTRSRRTCRRASTRAPPRRSRPPTTAVTQQVTAAVQAQVAAGAVPAAAAQGSSTSRSPPRCRLPSSRLCEAAAHSKAHASRRQTASSPSTGRDAAQRRLLVDKVVPDARRSRSTRARTSSSASQQPTRATRRS